ncbi:MAG TPA: glycosyltransferase family 39 protein [Jatrophihabitantaceae bacterium]|jgi:mannosyltransferase
MTIGAAVAGPNVTWRRRLATPRTIQLTVPRAATVAMSLAAVASLPMIGNQPLSWDEAVTLSAAQRSLPNLMALLHQRDAPLGPYYVLIHAWLGLLRAVGIDPTAAWLRLPSALGAIGACGLLVVVVARWFSARAALLAGVLLAVHPMLTFYAQDARPYALVTCAYLASTWALLRALDRPSVGRLIGYALLATATIYLHLFAIYALATHVVLVARRPFRARWAVAGASIAIAAVPLVLLAHGETAELGWIPRPSPSAVATVIVHMFGGAALGVALVLLAALALRHGGLPRDRRTVFVLAWLLVPVAALIAVDFVVPDLVARYGLVSVPAAAVLVAAAADRRPSWDVKALVAVVLVIAAVTTGWQQSRPFKYEDYRSAADAMGDLAHPGDAVMFFPITTRLGFEAYQAIEPDLRNVHDLALLPGVPPTATRELGGVDRPASALMTVFRSAPTIFVLGDSVSQARRSLHDPTDAAQQAALSGYRASRLLRYGSVYLTVLQRDPSRS